MGREEGPGTGGHWSVLVGRHGGKVRVHKCYIWNSLSHPVRFKGWGHNGGKGVTHELMSMLTWRTQVPGTQGHGWHEGIREAHTGKTWSTRRIAGTGTLWSAAGMSYVALGEVRALSPHTFIVQQRQHMQWDCPQHCISQDWQQYSFLRKYIVHLSFSMDARWEKQPKVIHWLTSHSYFNFKA